MPSSEGVLYVARIVPTTEADEPGPPGYAPLPSSLYAPLDLEPAEPAYQQLPQADQAYEKLPADIGAAPLSDLIGPGKSLQLYAVKMCLALSQVIGP